jgi:hypothetical protein
LLAQDGRCNGCDDLLELNVLAQGGECNDFDGLLQLTLFGRTVRVMVVMVCCS